MAAEGHRPDEGLSYAILGTGALGGFYGVRLAHAGKDVHFLLHSDYEHVRQHGLVMDSPEGQIRLPEVRAYANVEQMPRCDVVCVCLKTTQSRLLTEMLPQAVKPGGGVLAMQNGLGVEEEIAALVPEADVFGVGCYLRSHKVGPGHIQHLDYGYITIGPFGSSSAGLLAKIRSDFEDAGITAELDHDIVTTRWKKLVWNIPYNGLTVVLGTTTKEIMRDPAARSLTEALMLEVIAGGRACGCDISPDYATQMLEFTDEMVPYQPSMKLDFDAGRPMEIEYLYEAPVSLARANGCEMPKVEALCQQLRFLSGSRK